MTAQIVQPKDVSDELVVAMRSLSPHQQAQVIDFARFLAQQPIALEVQGRSGQSNVVAEENWVDRVSGSFKDDAEFDEVLRYGRQYRESSSHSEYCDSFGDDESA